MTNTPTDPVVEMLINGVWTDITDDCRLNSADSGGGIDITRGRPNEGSTAEPTGIDFTLNNLGGAYSPKNPNSIYYGQLGRNQPVRVGLDRRKDLFARTAQDSWGSLPDRVDREKKVIPGERWSVTGSSTNYDVNGSEATIQSAAGTQFASFGEFSDLDIKVRMKMSTRDSESGVVLRLAAIEKAGQADGTMEAGVSDWAGTGGTWASSTAQFFTGLKSGLLTVSGSPVTAFVRPITSKLAPVIAGGSYRIRTRARASFTGNVFLSWDWYDTAGTFISTSTSGALGVTANTWFLLEYTATAPTGASFGGYGPTLTGSPANGTTLFVDDLLYLDLNNLNWYTAYVTPMTAPTPDRLRIGKIAPGTSIAFGADWSGGNYLTNTYYWLHAQAAGHRFRMNFWLDGTTEPDDWQLTNYDNRTNEPAGPTHGQAGVYVSGGTSLVTYDSFEVNQWRGHAEITKLPVRFDLSRHDRWVPVAAKGVLRRLGQGRKSLSSAVRLHLARYAPSALWFPLEAAADDDASNEVVGGLPAITVDLDFGTPDLAGGEAMPGIAGFANFTKATSTLVGQAIPYVSATGKWTLLFFFKIPAGPSTNSVWTSISCTGTIRTWQFIINTDRTITINGRTADGTIFTTGLAQPYVAFPGTGWIAATLYLTPNGGNVDWAFNYHQPGGTGFFTANGTYAGTTGAFRSIFIRSTSVLETSGGFQISQIFHYAGDLPFVTYQFARAAAAYVGETAGDRWVRLSSDANVRATLMGGTGGTEPMGAQLPAKLLDLLEQCAAAEDSFIMEERDSLAISMYTRQALMNTEPLTMDIDFGHLSSPLDVTEDDQSTRNDVTVTRPNGGFAVARQTSGPLNINEPETDPDGVGIIDESVELSFAANSQLPSAANWRLARGTLDEARYPSMTADLASSTYQADRALTVRALAIDAGRQLILDNPEVSPDPAYQLVQSYTEKIDQYEHDLTWVAQPGRLWRVGVVGNTSDLVRYRDEARVQPAGIVTQATFISGTDQFMSVQATAGNALWFATADDPKVADFEIDVSGVRLKLRCVGQNLTTNGDFETGVVAGTWTPGGGGAMFIDKNDPKNGVYCARLLAAGAGAADLQQTQAGNAVTVAATSYAVCGWVKTEIAATDFKLVVDWYQSNGTTFISSSTPILITTLANTWTWFSAVVTSPALGVRARVKARNVFAGATNMWVDDIRLIPQTSYNTTPQVITVDQVPVNGIIKTIPSGQRLTLAKPARVAW